MISGICINHLFRTYVKSIKEKKRVTFIFLLSALSKLCIRICQIIIEVDLNMDSHCPACQSKAIKKNGYTRHGKQNHRCLDCGRQFSLEPKFPSDVVPIFTKPEELFIECRVIN